MCAFGHTWKGTFAAPHLDWPAELGLPFVPACVVEHRFALSNYDAVHFRSNTAAPDNRWSNTVGKKSDTLPTGPSQQLLRILWVQRRHGADHRVCRYPQFLRR